MESFIHALTWAEIPVLDFERAKKFYCTIYDFDMPEMPMGENRMGILLHDQEKAGIGAAIVQGPDYRPAKTGVKIYLNGGTDLNTVLNRVEKAGGKVTQPKVLISEELGAFAAFEDTEGNQLYLHSLK